MTEHTTKTAMTTPTTAEPPVPICSCIEYWPGDGHAPDCPVLREILAARATIARLEGELAPVRTAQRMGSALVPVSPELLAEGAFTEQPLHVMLTDNGDGTHTITFRESEELRTLRTRADAAERRVEVFAAGLRAVEALIHESHGVVGLHLNGDIAVWEDLRTGGRFEEWLLDFDTALAAASGDTTTTEG